MINYKPGKIYQMAVVWSSVSQLILNRKVLSVPQTKTKTRFWFLLNTMLAWKKELIPTCISEVGLDTISSRKPPLITKDQVRSLLSVPTAPNHETEHPVARLPIYVCGPPRLCAPCSSQHSQPGTNQALNKNALNQWKPLSDTSLPEDKIPSPALKKHFTLPRFQGNICPQV